MRFAVLAPSVWKVLAIFLSFSPLAPPLLLAQDAPRASLRTFLDCQSRNCNSQEFRTEIQFVDWVTQTTASDVHVIMTSQTTGGGGEEYILDFIGRNDLAGQEIRLAHLAGATDSRDEVLSELIPVLRAGLASFMAKAGLAGRLRIEGTVGPISETAAQAPPLSDPWNLWVFEVGTQVALEGEESQSERGVEVNLSANRTTEDWKIDLEVEGEFERESVTLSDGVFVNRTQEWEAGALVVKSLSPHWSLGGGASALSSTNLNQELLVRTSAALEWSLFPYSEANRRQVLVHYSLGLARVKYEEETLFGVMEETLPDQRLVVAHDTRQTWGEVSGSVRYSSYLRDLSSYSVDFGLGLSVRLIRGLELDVNARYELIRDQIYLPAQDLSDEEILLQRRQLATGYEYDLSVGLSYRFGSVLNNVVNNRFPWNVIN